MPFNKGLTKEQLKRHLQEYIKCKEEGNETGAGQIVLSLRVAGWRILYDGDYYIYRPGGRKIRLGDF